MQYISSFIIAWVPFLADPDFQIIIIAVMSFQLLSKLVKKLLKIFATAIRMAITAAIIGLVLYFAIAQPKLEDKSISQKVGVALSYLKEEFPIFLAEVKSTIPKG